MSLCAGEKPADVAADDTIYAALRVSGAVETASSEERPQDHLMGGSGYAVGRR